MASAHTSPAATKNTPQTSAAWRLISLAAADCWGSGGVVFFGARLRAGADLVDFEELARVVVFFLAPLLVAESDDFLRDAGLRGGEVVVATVSTRVTRATTAPQGDLKPLDGSVERV